MTEKTYFYGKKTRKDADGNVIRPGTRGSGNLPGGIRNRSLLATVLPIPFILSAGNDVLHIARLRDPEYVGNEKNLPKASFKDIKVKSHWRVDKMKGRTPVKAHTRTVRERRTRSRKTRTRN